MTTKTLAFAHALYQLEKREAGDIYVFRGFQRAGNQPFPILLQDGPAGGIFPAAQPAQILGPEIAIPLAGDGSPYQGSGDPAAMAIYERREDDERIIYVFRQIDSSPATVQRAIEEVNEQKLSMAMASFYASPDYDIYSMKPTGEHTQVPVEFGHRRGHVDERIAPLIVEVWRLGLDTIGSCQQRPPGHAGEGKAYLGFIRMRDARFFYEKLSEAGIPANFVERKIKIGRKASPGAPEAEQLEFETASIHFEPDDIQRVVELMKSLR